MVRPLWILGAFGASATAAAWLLGASSQPLTPLTAEGEAPLAATLAPTAAAAAVDGNTRSDAPEIAEASIEVQGGESCDPPPSNREIEHWIEQLRDDGIRGNAMRALWDLEAAGDAAAPFLERTLRSVDRQQRQLAAYVLRRGAQAPSVQLLEVSVEALRRDVCAELWSTLIHPIAASSTRWLLGHTAAARPQIRRALAFGDDQQRFLAAYLLAASGHDDDREAVVRELVHHLRDNQIDGDAVMAAAGLYRLGPTASRSIAAWRNAVDEQARSLLDLVARDLAAPPRTDEELRSRKGMHRTTAIYHDPAVEFDIGRSRVATW